jgi:hypothetical protein
VDLHSDVIPHIPRRRKYRGIRMGVDVLLFGRGKIFLA